MADTTARRAGGPAERLAAEAAGAARVRALSTDPDVIALRVERVRVQVDRLMWSGIVLGLGFTVTNVQAFAAAGAPTWSTGWVAAWALDPMVSLVLIAVLRAEQTTARWQVRTGPWVRRARWSTLAATYAMNTWSAWAAGIPSQVVLHSAPPLVVFVAAEAVTGLREALTEAVHAAARAGQPHQAGSTAAAAPSGAAAAVEPGEIRAEPPTAEVIATSPNARDLNPRSEHASHPAVTDENRAGTAGHSDPRVVELHDQEEIDASAAACLLGVTEDEVLIRQRHGGLPDRLTVTALSDDTGPAGDGATPEPGPAGTGGAPAAADERVVELVELLAAGTPVTGVQAAALFGCSARTGRRLLTRAQSTRPSPPQALPGPDRGAGADHTPCRPSRGQGLSTNVLQLRARWS